MATGPEHYREAEQLLSQAACDFLSEGIQPTHAFAAAQVHATLALAAATALNDHSHDEGGMPLEDYDAWVKVAAVWQPKGKGGEG